MAAGASLVLGGFLVLWGFLPGVPGGAPGLSGGPWGVLYVRGGVPREAVRALGDRGLEVVDGSSLWVLLDDFGEIRRLPLDEYDDALEPFDPRNDGYGAALGAFFSRPGEGRIFIRPGEGSRGLPEILRRLPESSRGLTEIVREVLGPGEGSRWRVEFPRKTGGAALAAFAAASAICAVLGGRGSRFGLLCALPGPAFLTLAGPGGLVPAGILTAVFFLAREPLAEWFRSAGPSGAIHRSPGGELAGWFHTFPRELAGGAGGFVLYGAACLAGAVPPSLALGALLFFVPLLLLPPWAESRTVRNRFFPLPVRPARFRRLFPPCLPVFALAYGALLIASLLGGIRAGGDPAPAPAYPAMSAAYPAPAYPAMSAGGWPPPPDGAAFRRHAAFQRSFSRRSLRPGGSGVPYGTYTVRPGGLIGGFTADSPGASPDGPADAGPSGPDTEELPPYLETLARLGAVSAAIASGPPGGLSPGRSLALLGLMAALSLPALANLEARRRARRPGTQRGT
ncbi:MAG: hypothetical protein LBD09_06230 [Treponema sp.]|nr:hypothetical protein [Treponema sp.]